MGGCQIQFTVSPLTCNLFNVYINVPVCVRPCCVSVRVSISGGDRFYSIQWRSQKQLLPPLHPPLPAQWVPQSAGGCRRDMPRLWQVESTPSIIVPPNADTRACIQTQTHSGFSLWESNPSTKVSMKKTPSSFALWTSQSFCPLFLPFSLSLIFLFFNEICLVFFFSSDKMFPAFGFGALIPPDFKVGHLGACTCVQKQRAEWVGWV